MLINNKGKSITTPMVVVASELFVANPTAKYMPLQATPKKTTVRKTSKIPKTPVAKVAPKRYAITRIMAD
jgi:hypothetical protein